MGQVISGFVHTRLSKQLAVTLALCTLGAGVFLFVLPIHAAGENFVTDSFIWAFGQIVQWIVGILGTLLINLFYILIAVAQYNQFLGSSAVSAGWVVVRDVVNMFFVLVLLAIAIGTILQQQQYHYSQTLPKFLAAAILVNFSKTICGIFIDFSQIVMMTFVGAISGAIGGNLAALLGIPTLLKQINPLRAEDTLAKIDALAFGGFFLALIFVCVALIVVGIMVVMLVIRIVALWFLIILSPTVFFFMALPSDRGYGSKWWDQFINYLLVGPVMMFFLWLSLTVVATQVSGANDATQIAIATEIGNWDAVGNGGAQIAIGSRLGGAGISTVGGIAGYILGICMLMATLMAAQQLSSVGGNIAGAGAGYVKDWFAGKRGPFNPFRAARETIGGVMARREERRKERVKGRVERFDRALGIIQGAPRAAAKFAAKGVMAHPGMKGVREAYQSDRVQTALDTGMRGLTFGLGGWGQKHQVRLAEFRKSQDDVISSLEPEIGKHRGEAEKEDLAAADFEAQALHAHKQKDYTSEQKLRAQAAGRRQSAVSSRQSAEKLENQVTLAKGRLLRNTLRQKAASLYGKGARLLATGAMGGVPLLYTPPMLDDLGKAGDAHVVSVERAQGEAVSSDAKKYDADNLDEVNGKLAGSLPGYETKLQKMGLIMAKLGKDGYGVGEIDGVRRTMKGLGADHETMKVFEAGVLKKYPTGSFLLNDEIEKTRKSSGGPDSRTARELVREKKIKGEDLTKETMDAQQDLASVMLDEVSNYEKEGDQFEVFNGMKKDNARKTAQENYKNTLNGMRDPQTGAIRAGEEQRFARIMRPFLIAGGKLSDILTSIDSTQGDFTNDEERNIYKDLMNKKELAHIVAQSLPQNLYDDKKNYTQPILQAVANATVNPDTRDGFMENMRGYYSSTNKTQKESGARAIDFIGDYNEVVKPVGIFQEDLKAAQSELQAVQDEIKNSVKAISGAVLDRNKKEQTLLTAKQQAGGQFRQQREVRGRGGDQLAVYEIQQADAALQEAQRIFDEADAIHKQAQQRAQQLPASLSEKQQRVQDATDAVQNATATGHVEINERAAKRAKNMAPRLG